jgi:hypothetical protein
MARQGLDIIGADSGNFDTWGFLKSATPAVVDTAQKIDTSVESAKGKKADNKGTDTKGSASSDGKPGTAGGTPDGESFLTKQVVGPVRVWHALLAGVVTVGGVIFWKKRAK